MSKKLKTLSTTQAALLIGVSDQSVANWVDSGELRAGKTPGGHRRIAQGDLIDFLRRQNLRIPAELLPPGTTILVIDDEPEVGQSLKKAFKAKHREWNVLIAPDGFAAGEAVATNPPNVVVLNLHMPGLDGFDVCRRIKSNRLAGHAAVIAVTAHPSEETEKAATQAGAAAYLPKPLDIDLLCQTIQEQLPARE